MTVSPELDRRFRERAASERLLDVGYDLVETPIGTLLVATSQRGVCRISYDPEPQAEVERLARSFGARVLRSPTSTRTVETQLDEYFAGRRRDFELDLDLRLAAAFSRRVLEELARVGYGQVTTYGALAARAGHPTAARAVGTVMNRNPLPIVLPCHRVLGASGSLTGYGGGLERKRALLELEGVALASAGARTSRPYPSRSR